MTLNLPPLSFFSRAASGDPASNQDPAAAMPAALNVPSTDVPVMPAVTSDPSGVVDPATSAPSAQSAAPSSATLAASSMPFLPVGEVGEQPLTATNNAVPQPEPPAAPEPVLSIAAEPVAAAPAAPVPPADPVSPATPAGPSEPAAAPAPAPAPAAQTEEAPLMVSPPPTSDPVVTEPTTAPPVAAPAAPPTTEPAQAKTIAINGFGRIGRTAFRVWWSRFRDQVPLVAINTSGSSDLATWVNLLKYDSNYGVFPAEVTFTQKQTKDQVTEADPELGTITIEGHTITVLAQREPAKIPWAKYGVQTVIESSGKFVTQETASAHLQAGAQRVLVSAPPKGEGEQGGMDMTLLGVQETLPTGQVLSNASCTTNCVAPVAAIMQDKFGVEKAMLTTIHAYTDDQNLHDNSHKDLRRARAAATNIVPTSTGAARSVGQVVPEMASTFDGLAVRVPVAVGSLSDLVFVTSRDVTVEEVNAAFTSAVQQSRWQGIVAVTTDPIVSSDIVGRPESAIIDLSLTQVVGGNMVKVIAWYDNEFGYCNRLVEVAVA